MNQNHDILIYKQYEPYVNLLKINKMFEILLFQK